MRNNENLIYVNENDNLAILLRNLEKNTEISFFDKTIFLKQDTFIGERIAIKNIKKGELLFQYGSKFAIANQNIGIGENVTRDKIVDINENFDDETIFNLKTNISNTISNNFEEIKNKKFKGIVRSDGKVGTRNYYVLIPTSFCATDIANKLSYKFDTQEYLELYPNIDGIVSAGHTEGCGCGSGDIIDRLMLVIKNFISHPNCGGALIIDLGCEKTNYHVINKYLGNYKNMGKPINFLTIQEVGGTLKSLEKGKKIIRQNLSTINNIKREDCELSKLIVGTECGASDSFSGLTANPLIGSIADKIVELNGSAILSETPEMLGAEHILLERMPSIDVRKRFINGINYYKNLAKSLNINIEGNLVAGNLKGGLINLTLKSLGSIQKGGTKEIVDFLDYGEEIRNKGLNIMNGPGNDFESMTGLISSGANIILFSTGMGTTEGSLISPVVKVSSNSNLYNRMSDDIDFNAGRILENESIESLSIEFFDYVVKVASGEERTFSEKYRKRAFQIWSAGKLSL